MNSPDIPYEVVERVLRNSRGKCQYCHVLFDNKDRVGFRVRRLSKTWPLYDPRNTVALCVSCDKAVEKHLEHMTFIYDQK